ncbi:MAG: asparagine synthase, partial [Gammaproteobacteria bacterium]|nr:asparagine synthase [Gammaproteobacteria bacterium]
DRKLLERLLTFPLHVFRVGNRPRGLARELGRGLIPESVRLRRNHSVHFPDETAWFALRAHDYHNALQSIRGSSTCGFFLDMASLESWLQTLCAGRGSAQAALQVHRALDAGLFAAGFESGHGLQPPADFEMTHSVPTLNVLAGPVESAPRAQA